MQLRDLVFLVLEDSLLAVGVGLLGLELAELILDLLEAAGGVGSVYTNYIVCSLAVNLVKKKLVRCS